MARRGVKKKEHERLDDTTVGRVVSLLEQDSPITKKAACEILNISYNTTRLNRIIEEYKERIEFNKKRRAALRGKPSAQLGTISMISFTLSGSPPANSHTTSS